MFEIYVITNKLNGRRYVGQTSRSYLDRFNEHCYYAYIHPKLNKYLAKDIRLFGKDNFAVRRLLKNLSKQEAKYYEEVWIRKLHAHISEGGYNITYGVGITGIKRGHNFSEHISKSLRGKPKTVEHKKHLSDSAKQSYLNGRVVNFKGKHHRQSVKNLISDIQSVPVYMFTKDTKQFIREFKNLREAKDWLVEHNLTRNKDAMSRICGVCLGKKDYKSAYGYYWSHNKEV